MKTLLITGAAGFIGWKTAEKASEMGYKVVGVDNMNDYYDVRLKEWRLNQLLKRENFQFYKVDIEDRDELAKIFNAHRFDAVINLAARAGVRQSIENPFVYFSTNVTGTLNLLEICKDLGISKFIIASTSSIYAGQPMPFREDLAVNQPISPYAASKKAAEVLCYTYHCLYDIDVTVLRYFTVYGPAGRPDMSVFRFIKWIHEGKPVEVYGDGTQSRDFTYVDDIADGTIKALKPVGYEIINLGGGRNPKSINELISTIERLLGKKAKVKNLPFHKADLQSTWADIEKAKKILGWAPTLDIEAGLKSTIEWYLSNDDWLASVEV